MTFDIKRSVSISVVSVVVYRIFNWLLDLLLPYVSFIFLLGFLVFTVAISIIIYANHKYFMTPDVPAGVKPGFYFGFVLASVFVLLNLLIDEVFNLFRIGNDFYSYTGLQAVLVIILISSIVGFYKSRRIQN